MKEGIKEGKEIYVVPTGRELGLAWRNPQQRSLDQHLLPTANTHHSVIPIAIILFRMFKSAGMRTLQAIIAWRSSPVDRITQGGPCMTKIQCHRS